MPILADFITPKLNEARLRSSELRRSEGGGGGIRTHDALSDIIALQAIALGHYATPPRFLGST